MSESTDTLREPICFHCGNRLEWQKRLPDDNSCAQGYWFTHITGSGCPKSDYGHERILSGEVWQASAREAQPQIAYLAEQLAVKIWDNWHGPLARIPGTHKDAVIELSKMLAEISDDDGCAREAVQPPVRRTSEDCDHG